MDFILPTKITKRRKWLPGKKAEKGKRGNEEKMSF